MVAPPLPYCCWLRLRKRKRPGVDLLVNPLSPFRRPKSSWTKCLTVTHPSGDSQGYSSVGETSPTSHWMSLPPQGLSEPDEDGTISPYASYTSMTEKAPPIICSWLDKLSPQG